MSEPTSYSELFNQLLDVDGSFLTVPVARKAFGKQLARADQRVVDELRIAREELHADQALTSQWIRWVLGRVLDLDAEVLKEGPSITHLSRLAQYGVTLRPTLALFAPDTDGGKPSMLVTEWRPEQDLNKKAETDIWSASPVARMIELCQVLKVPIGLVTNGRSWVLVSAPDGERSSTVTWDAELWLEERETLDLFIAALGAERFFGVEDGLTLPALLEESADDEEQVTTTLGRQVRRAVELLVSAFSDAHRASGGELLANVAAETTYRAAVTVMMRLVFLLSAEERELLLLGDETYDAHYAISTMLDQLEDEPDLDVLFNRFDAWPRMLATFRLVHGGAQHDQRLNLPAYGGHLFDPDRFPFLEGRVEGEPVDGWVSDRSLLGGINNRVILEILRSLQRLSIEEFKEVRRLSFRLLDVEQIGTVYEGLLDHTCTIVSTTTLGTLAKPSKKSGSIEPEIPLSELVEKLADGRTALEAHLKKTYKFNASQLKKLEVQPDERQRARLRSACGNDDDLLEAVLPFFGILRTDLRGLPEVFLENSYVVVDSRERSDTGAHYTPRVIAEELVRYALEPLVYEPGPQNETDPNKWKLRPWQEVADLKIVDPACGSGAMLVAANRYMTDRLVEAWREQEVETGVGLPLPGAEGAPFFLPANEEDWPLSASRLVAGRCLYGVDVNDMAVEMCKLSLWLVTLAKGKPFSFLDHAIRHGDSLLGITRLEELEHLTMGADIEDSRDWSGQIRPFIDRAIERRRDLLGIPSLDAKDLEEKDRLLDEAEREMAAVSAIADALAGAYLSTADRPAGERDTRILSLAAQVDEVFGEAPESDNAIAQMRSQTDYWLDTGRPPIAPDRVTLHWPLAFPEVFVDGRGRFDATVSNPPFLGGQKLTGTYGTNYREHVVEIISGGERGSADLVAYFFLRAQAVAEITGYLATNTIGQGDTSEVGLAQIIDNGSTIFRAKSSVAWPGTAAVEVSQLWISSAGWTTDVDLDGATVAEIDEMLYRASPSGWRKHALAANSDQSFIGSYVLGMGFTVEPSKAQELITRDSRNREVLFPYLGGEDLNQSPTLEAPRWVINFHDWAEERARQYVECFEIVEQKVKPFRQERKADGRYIRRDPLPQKYWIYAEKRPALVKAIAHLDRVLAICRVSKVVSPVFVQSGQVLSEQTVVFALDDDFSFGVMTSGFHYRWACRYASTLESRVRYTPSDVFDSFPRPDSAFERVGAIGSTLNDLRSQRMIEANEGLTDTYNRVHKPDDDTPTIVRLREMHVELDLAVRDAYGWDDLELEHGFHPVRGQGIRYTFSPDAAVEVLYRLLELNRERYEQEVREGLHGDAAKRNVGKTPKQTESLPL